MEITTLDIKRFMEKHPKLILRKESKTYPGLFVLKYAKAVFYDGLWTPELEWCRGLVVDADWNVVVQPFKKIYNRFERDTDFDLEEQVSYYRKVNGFMAGATWLPDSEEIIVSTTGSLDSDFVGMAKSQLFTNKSEREWINYLINMNMPHMTMLFEIVHPNDPHIVYEVPGAYGLAVNVRPDGFNRQGLDSMFFGQFPIGMAERLGCFEIKGQDGKFKDVVKAASVCEHEGFVVYAGGFNRGLKIKSPYYLVTKFFARKSEKKLKDILFSDKWKQVVDEEYYDLVDFLRRNAGDFIAQEEQGRIGIVQAWFEQRLKKNA